MYDDDPSAWANRRAPTQYYVAGQWRADARRMLDFLATCVDGLRPPWAMARVSAASGAYARAGHEPAVETGVDGGDRIGVCRLQGRAEYVWLAVWMRSARSTCT